MPNVTFPIEASHVMMFARAIGDDNAAYHDAGQAKASEVGGIIAPPTFTQAVAQFDPASPLRPHAGEPWPGVATAGRLHAEQHFEYVRPPRPGDVLTAEMKPGKIWERASERSGRLLFSETITEFRDQTGQLVVTARSVTVVPERTAARQGD